MVVLNPLVKHFHCLLDKLVLAALYSVCYRNSLLVKVNGSCYATLRRWNLVKGISSKHTFEDVALSVLLRICDYLDCDIGDICQAVRAGN